jgi:hypothetical protein
MAGPPNKGYKRSWKNLLINKRYQLRFTLFMVGLSALLMAGLGLWVMKEANDATSVAKSSIAGDACPKVPVISGTVNDDNGGVPLKLDGEGSAVEAPTDAPSKMQHSAVDPKDVAHHNANDDVIAVQNAWCLDASCTAEQAAPLEIKMSTPARCDAYVKRKLRDADAVAALRKALVPVVKCEDGGSFTVADADATPSEHHVKVQLDESSMTMMPAPPSSRMLPADYSNRLVAHWACVYRNQGKIADLEAGRRRILWVLVITGLALVFGLAIYGIKMTHRVAGPLFKVSLYLAKMKDGRYDKVWNLRKGDQLVEFYDHFKSAHGGVVALERGDIEQMTALIAAAKAAGAGETEAVKDLEALVARKEKAFE